MSITYLKRASKSAATDEESTRATVSEMLVNIEAGGESRCAEYAAQLDGYHGNIIVTNEEIEQATRRLSTQVKDDIHFAHERVTKFAQQQRKALIDFEVELSPGLWAAQKQIPVQTAGCYIPGGRYSHVASAIMSVATAKAAGVKHIVACSPPKPETGVHDAILYTAHYSGADTILALGGVQGIAAMAFGLFSGRAADVLAGPGNRFVAEAKRMLFGRVGIDMFAGPTEIAVIADSQADPRMIAGDLVGQAEHGPDSPVWLISLDLGIAQKVIDLVPGLIESMPEPSRSAARSAWADYAEVVVCSSREEAVQVSDQYAAEHLELHCQDLDWWSENLNNYGSLFVGEETTVTYGDKCSGTNHILPTKGAARYTGGLSVGKFIKTVTSQRMTEQANREVGATAARISRLEGMEGHARSGDDRLAKYFPDEVFRLT